MKTFTATPTIKIGTLAIFILILILIGIFAFIASGLTSIFIDFGITFDNDPSLSPVAIIIWALCSLPIVFFGLLSIWMLAYSIAVWKARLIFDNRSMTFEISPRLPSYRNRGLKPFSIPYDQIQRINSFGETGTLEIFDLQGKIYRLAPVMFGKNYGDNVLAELSSHLPSEMLGSIRDHSKIQKTWAKKQRIATIPLMICLIALLITFFFDPRISSRPWTDAWHVEFNPTWTESVQRYSTGEDGKFWIIGYHIEYYRIYRFPDEKNQEWILPDSVLGDSYPNAVGADSAGNPIVWTNEKNFHYQNGSWQIISPPNKWSYIDWEERGVPLGDKAWAVTQDKQFIKIDALTGDWDILPLPETAKNVGLSPVSMRLSTQGNFLVLMENNSEHEVFLYKIKDEKWASQQYTVLLPKETRIEDYFLDPNGFLWVLAVSKTETIVEKIDQAGDFTWTSVPAPLNTENWYYYERVYTDVHGRMWISSASYPPFITVFQPVWKGDAKKIVTYTPGNSNYQEDTFSNPFMSSEGKIWGFDQRITSMDTNQKELPAPLPDWFGNIDWNLVRLAIFPFQIIASIYMTILSVSMAKQIRQKNQIR